MKVNLLLTNLNDARSGYLNISPLDHPSVTKGDPTNLDPLVDDGEAAEIIALDVLGCVPPQNVDAVLLGWIRKLAYGGTLTVSVTDLREVARATLSDTVSLEELNLLIYGAQTTPWQTKRFATTLDSLVQVMSSHLKILSKRIVGATAVVIGQRPTL